MFVTPAFAQASPFGGDGMLMQLLPFAVLLLIIYFLILRPQQKRVKEHQELIKNLRRVKLMPAVYGAPRRTEQAPFDGVYLALHGAMPIPESRMRTTA